MPSKLLLYIHGFQSSPQSHKAQLTAHYIAQNELDCDIAIPQLDVYPQAALAQLLNIIEQNEGREISLIGSSLGGYFALHIAHRYGLRAALINPSIYPYETIAAHLGPQVQPYTGEHFELQAQHMEQLRAMAVKIRPHEYQNFLLLLQTGDETLNYAEAASCLYSVRSVIEYGGDHSFTGFSRWLPEIAHFLQLS